ncbi:hypothetical protein [Geomicrobium sp. JCM 19039]|uniref:LolA family protein n=1 Tax=Geomicrobium sp. JCM 19039 TaxID=1460636 RepID=UPI00045F3534|nr:hypothetical protein [Geomicrobium sp. JCM 19039]GAK11808.1 hypothetical protein JCM19039_1525 [Geomicrobium sp. JCM 19039]
MKKQVVYSAALLPSFLLAGCAVTPPQEILSNVTDSSKTPTSYYLETEVTFTMDELEETILLKEWRNEEAYRMDIHESLGVSKTVESADQSITYMEEEELVLISENQGSPPAEVNYLNDVYDLEDIEQLDFRVAGEETILGRDTYELQMEGEESFKLWVDQSTWVILRWERGGLQTEALVYEENPDWNEDPFDLQYPDTAEVIYTDVTDQTISKDEVEAMFEPSVRIHSDNEDIDLREMYQYSTEVTLEYFLDLSPYMILTIAEEKNEYLHENDQVDSFESFVPISVWEIPGGYALSWEEEGLYYSLYPEDPAVEVEELQQFVESLSNTK